VQSESIWVEIVKIDKVCLLAKLPTFFGTITNPKRGAENAYRADSHGDFWSILRQ